MQGPIIGLNTIFSTRKKYFFLSSHSMIFFYSTFSQAFLSFCLPNETYGDFIFYTYGMCIVITSFYFMLSFVLNFLFKFYYPPLLPPPKKMTSAFPLPRGMEGIFSPGKMYAKRKPKMLNRAWREHMGVQSRGKTSFSPK
jgi:hypothetical protein